MSCEDSAWLVIRFFSQFIAVAVWAASTLGLAVFVLFVGGKFRWIK